MATSISHEEYERLVSKGLKEETIVSYFPCDHWDCECQPLIKNLNVRFSTMSLSDMKAFKEKTKKLECPKSKRGKKKYYVVCNECKAVVGECYANNKSLEDYCDFHYVCTSVIDNIKKPIFVVEKGKMKKKYEIQDAGHWVGALAINISPIDGKLGIECTCGNDSRDFRANTSLKTKELKKHLNRTKNGREFGTKDSKYRLEEIV